MHFILWFCFFTWCSDRNYKLCKGLEICAITAGIKKFKSIIKKNKKKRDKIVFVVSKKLNSIKVLISKSLINSNICHDEFILINSGLKE